MITVKKVFEKDGTAVYQAYEQQILGEVVVKGNTIVREQLAPVKKAQSCRDFMLRSVVFLLTQQFDEVAVSYVDPYFKTLGFAETDGGMRQKSQIIVFPSQCGAHGAK